MNLDKEILSFLLQGNLGKIKVYFNKENINNTYNDRSYTALSMCIFSNNYESIEYLISIGAFINFQDKYLNSPLSDLLEINSPDIRIVKLLVEKGANINSYDNKGNTPLFNACLNKTINLDIIKYLIENSAYMYYRCFLTSSDRGLKEFILEYSKEIREDILEYIKLNSLKDVLDYSNIIEIHKK